MSKINIFEDMFILQKKKRKAKLMVMFELFFSTLMNIKYMYCGKLSRQRNPQNFVFNE